MTSIAWLEKQISSAENALDAGSRATPVGRLSAASIEHHLNELRAELRCALEERELEVLDLGLNIPQEPAKDSSLPLGLLGDISTHLANTIHYIARFEERGTFGGQIPDEIRSTMDLRLASIQAGGSTHLWITGQTAPDLFGHSLLAESLKTTFEILSSEDPVALIDAASEAGPRSVSSLASLLRSVQRADAGLSLKWESPSGATRRWTGDSAAINRLAESLAALEELPGERIEEVGEIVTLSSRRHFELMVPGEPSPLTARVSQEAKDHLEDFHVGQKVAATLNRKVFKSRATGLQKNKYILEELRAL